MKLKQRLFAFQCLGSITLSPRIFWSAFLTKNFPDEKSIPRTSSSAHRDPRSPAFSCTLQQSDALTGISFLPGGMAFLSALPSGGVCAVFTDAQLAKTSEATSNTVVTWSFIAFRNAKFRGRSRSFGAARTDRDSTVATRAQRATCIKNSGLSAKSLMKGLPRGRPSIPP